MSGDNNFADSPAGERYWLETLGCPKNEVDSAKLRASLHADGLRPAASAEDADVVVVNTCAFVEEAREESIGAILSLDDQRSDDSRLVVTGCLAQRSAAELAEALPEVDQIVALDDLAADSAASAPTSVAVSLTAKPKLVVPHALDLLDATPLASDQPWAYVKIAEGCDRACGFCAIPSFRGPQRSRSVESICAEVEALEVQEVVLIAQDLASFGRDQGQGEKRIAELVRAVSDRVEWVRLLYLYPSELTDAFVDTMCESAVPYFDLSLQHVSPPLMRRMRRWGDGERFAKRVEEIRAREPGAAFRSNFIVGYPGETEEDHDALMDFVEQTRLEWCGFFAFSREEGTLADTQDGHVDPGLVAERIHELRERQDEITAECQDARIGSTARVLVDQPGIARSAAEAPEIDGIIEVPEDLAVGEFHEVAITDSLGVDLRAAVVNP